MGLFFKARGNISVGLLLIRFSLGFIFLFSGSAKVVNLETYISNVKELGILNENLSFIVGFFLPFVEIIFGSLFIIGLFTPLTSFILSMLIVSYLFLFGTGSESLPYSHFIVFLSCTITTLFAGAGMVSFDALLDKAKKNERRELIVEKTVHEPERTHREVVHGEEVQKEVKKTDDSTHKEEKVDVTLKNQNEEDYKGHDKID
jgi:uncharacterized membrane protein YphA (DoxX/SURF4 family)